MHTVETNSEQICNQQIRTDGKTFQKRMWASKKIFDTEYIHISSGHGKNEDNVEIYAPPPPLKLSPFDAVNLPLG